MWAAVFFVAAVMLLCACNAQKKNTAAARQYTAFITRYNIYYNGDKHFKETLGDMESKYEDDYSRLVFMHPIEAKIDEKAPQPSGNFDRSIEKAQKAIQVRSIKKKPVKKSGKSTPEYKAWMKRDEYNPFIHNAWMMLGKSQYYNGDFMGAASTFQYISKHFTWLPEVVTDAKLWQAQSYIALDWLYEAEAIITRIKPDELTDKQLKSQYDFCYADFLLHNKEYAKAVPYLENAIKGAKGEQKTRLRFLQGQVYAKLGEKTLAYEAFKRAASSSSASYRTKFNARIKQSEVYSGADIAPEVKSLLRMTRYDRNKDYLDQIYYAVGNLYLSRQDTANAISNYELAAEKSKRNGIDKAISQITLGGLYFDLGNYQKAQPCYSEAVPLLPESYPDYKLLKRRSDVLDELAQYSENVNLQDSLLRLAAMPEAERLEVIDKIIKELKEREKKEAEEAARQEYMAQQAANGNQLNGGNDREFSINTDNSWYFYNQASRNSGKTEFQKRWGARKNEDDWRRRNKASFNVNDFDSDNEENEGEGDENEDSAREEEGKSEEEANLASDPHNREYYLAQLPSTPEEVANSHDIIQEGLYNMGIILKDKLEDYQAALNEFNRLLSDYPDNIYRLDVYYNLYLMYMRQGNETEAEKWRQLILSDFADSDYGIALQNPRYLENMRNMDKRQEELYEQTYEAYLNNQNQQVHEAYAIMMEEFPLSKIMPKFMFLDALAYVTEKKTDEFNAVLRSLLDRYPDTNITPIASAWLKGMAQGRKLQESASGTNMRGMLWDIHLTNDSTALANDSIGANFVIDDEAPQLIVFVYPTDNVSGNELLYEVARFNFNSFMVKDFDLETMNFGRLGMLIVRGFENQRAVNKYRSVMAETDALKLPSEVRPIPISVSNFETLLNQGRSFDEYFQFLQEQNYLDAQDGILNDDQKETLQEAEEAERLRQSDTHEEDAETETHDESTVPEQQELTPAPAITDAPTAQPTAQPTATPTSQPSSAPTAQPSSTPSAQPVSAPVPQPAQATPAQPEIPLGSEGEDDPLLNE